MWPIKEQHIPSLLSDPDTRAVPLMAVLEYSIPTAELYAEEQLDPMTVFQALEERWRVRLPEALKNRLQAIFTLLTTDVFENTVEGFKAVCLAFIDGHLGDQVAGVVEDVEFDEMLATIFEAAVIDPNLSTFSPKVANELLVAARAAQDGADNDDDLAEYIDALISQLSLLEVPVQTLSAIIATGNDAVEQACQFASNPENAG